jgi:hypothetical protein
MSSHGTGDKVTCVFVAPSNPEIPDAVSVERNATGKIVQVGHMFSFVVFFRTEGNQLNSK